MPDSGPGPDDAFIETEDADDTTLGGYFRVHNRPPAFEGSDGHPYTVSVEVEKTGDLRSPCHGYLVFLRWAQNGVGIVGHVASPTLVEVGSSGEATDHLGRLSLLDVQRILEDALDRERKDPDRAPGQR